MAEINRIITFKAYENGMLINNKKVEQGKISEIVTSEITNRVGEIFGSSQLPIGDKRLNKEFEVEIIIKL